jgi:hypothetical protein
MKEERKTQPLQWLVDFANLDLERIGPGDRAKLLEESGCLWPGKELKRFDPLHLLSKEALEGFSWALEMPSKRSPEYWNAIIAAQTSIGNLFSLLQITAHPSAGAPSKAVASILRGHDEVLWLLEKGPGVPYKFVLLPVTQSQKDYLCIKIFRLLEGFNQHAIRRCPGCNQWFFNPTNREKNFCGNRCIWRTNTAKRRKAARGKADVSGKEKQARKAKGRRP